MASFKPAPAPSSTPKSSIHISIRAARDIILGASSHSNPLPLYSNLDARHPPSKRAPRKRLALNTKLYFSGNSSITLTHAVVKPKLVGWEGGLKLVDGETNVPPPVSSGSPGSHSSDQNSTTLVTSESLAMAILAVGSSDNNSTPSSRTSLRTALFQLPPSARPFQYTSYRNALDGPQVRNVYTPKFVQGQGWVPAFGGVNNEPEPVPAPSRPAATNSGPRYPVRASRAKPAANAEAGAGGEAGEAEAPVEEKTAAPTKPGGKGKNKNHGKGKAKVSKPSSAALAEKADEEARESSVAPATSTAGSKKRVRVQDAAEDSANGDTSIGDAAIDAEEDTGRATRASKRRKVASDMPPPSTIPPHAKGSSRKPNARDDSASLDGDNVEESSTTRKTRSAKRASTTAPEAEDSPDATMFDVESSAPGNSRSSGRATKARAGSHDNKSSSPPSSTASQAQAAPKDQPAKRSHKKKVPAPPAPQAETTSNSGKATSPVPPTHSYSTRRAGGMTRTVSNGSNSAAKGRTSPSGSDETLVERGGSALPSDSVSKIIPEPAPVAAVV